MRRCCAMFFCLTLLACGDAHPISGSVLESEQDEPDGQACSVEVAAQLFRRASQVDYSYEPSSPAELYERSSIVARGRITGVRPGVGEQTTPSVVSPTVEATFTLEEVFKGAIAPRNSLRFSIVSSPVVTEAERNALLTVPDNVAVVAFLTFGPGAGAPHATTSGSVLRVTSPQGLLVASACGVAGALDSLPLFGAQVQSLAQLDAAFGALRSP